MDIVSFSCLNSSVLTALFVDRFQNLNVAAVDTKARWYLDVVVENEIIHLMNAC